VLKVNEYGGRQAKGNEKRQCFKGWETLVKKELFSDIYQMVNPRNRKILCKFASDNMLYNVRNDRDRQ